MESDSEVPVVSLSSGSSVFCHENPPGLVFITRVCLDLLHITCPWCLHADHLTGQMYSGHTAPGMGYGGVQLPPGRDYNAGQGAGGGFPGHREVGHGAGRGTGGGGSRSDRPSIGSSHNEDCRDHRPPFRGVDRHFDDNHRRQENRERGRSSSSNQVGIGGGRDGGGTGNNTREDRGRGRDRDRDRERRDDERKRDQSPGLWASHDHKMSPAGNRDNRSWKESPRHDSLHR